MFYKKASKPLLLVANPKAGKCAAKQKLFDIISTLTHLGYEVSVYPTKRNATTEHLKNNAHRFERIVCCGGDGTLSEVLSGVYASGSKVPVGYIPMGSTNDYARNMGISSNVALSTYSAAKGETVSYDLGLFNGVPFSYIAAVGAFTAASYTAPQRLKNRLGHFAYIIEGAKSISDIKPIKITVEANGKTITDNFIYASVSNTTSVGGILKLNKDDVDYADGLFEVLLLRHPKNPAVAFELISDLLSGRFNTKNVALFHTKSIKLTFEKPVVFSLDGEKSEPCTQATLINRRNAVKVVVPSSKNKSKRLIKFKT